MLHACLCHYCRLLCCTAQHRPSSLCTHVNEASYIIHLDQFSDCSQERSMVLSSSQKKQLRNPDCLPEPHPAPAHDHFPFSARRGVREERIRARASATHTSQSLNDNRVPAYPRSTTRCPRERPTSTNTSTTFIGFHPNHGTYYRTREGQDH